MHHRCCVRAACPTMGGMGRAGKRRIRLNRIDDFGRVASRLLATLAEDMTGDEARALRMGLGMSAREVAEAVGTTESTVYRFEWRHDHSVPRMYALALKQVLQEMRRRERGQDADPPVNQRHAC